MATGVAIYFGTDLTTQLVEIAGSPTRQKNLEADVVTRKFKTAFDAVESLIPLFNTTSPGYPNHFLTSFSYSRTGEGSITDVTLTYETIDESTILNLNAPLPPDETEFIVGTTERHIGALTNAAGVRLYKPQWLGKPTVDGLSTGRRDPRGTPSVHVTDEDGEAISYDGILTKPGVESYLIPTAIYRKISWTHIKPALNTQGVGTRNIPPGELGTNQWLKTGYTLKIMKGVYQTSEEWTMLPLGKWDTDIYPAS